MLLIENKDKKILNLLVLLMKDRFNEELSIHSLATRLNIDRSVKFYRNRSGTPAGAPLLV